MNLARCAATRMLGPLEHDLETLRPGIGELRTAKLDVLAAAQNLYDRRESAQRLGSGRLLYLRTMLALCLGR